MIIRTHELAQGAPIPHQRQVYNGLDAALTYEVWEEISALSNQPPAIYAFARALQGPALEIMLRGFRVDLYERNKGIKLVEAERAKLDAILQRFAHAVWDKPLNPRSGDQLKKFFYKHMGIPEIWTSQKGIRALRMDRETLEKIEIYFHARPIVATIKAIREIGKKLDVLTADIDPDGRMRTSINIGATTTGRLSSSSSTTGTGCVLPSTEALTPNGWKRMDELRDGDVIAQWDREGDITFVPCKIFSKEYDGILLCLETEQVKQTLTPEHRVVAWNSKMSGPFIYPAIRAASHSQLNIPLAGHVSGGKQRYLSILATLMADFEKLPSGWRGALKKERKQDRFLELVEQQNIDCHEEGYQSREGYRRFYVKGLWEWPKKWGPWIIDADPESLAELIEEARHWDSWDAQRSKYSQGPGFTFWTADKDQADWFAIAVHLTGRSCSVFRMEQPKGSYSDITMWGVHVKERKHANIQRKHWSIIDYSGTVYCPQVPSSFWLMRESGKISVTGNTNMFNLEPALRRMFIADPGWKLCGIDKEQAEAREVGWLCWIAFGDGSYLDACESSDLHCYTAKLIWPNLSWTGDPHHDRAVADQQFYRHFSYRDLAKRGGHGSSYRGTPFTMARHLKVPTKLMEDFQQRFFDAFPCIPRWHDWVASELQSKRKLTTVFGRERHFFGRPGDDTTLREAIAYSPQSATADRVNLGMWRIWDHFGDRIQLLLNLYDAVYFQYRESDNEREIIETALRLMEVPLEHNGRVFDIPGEAKVGWNWAAYAEDNPEGLKKWTGADTRQRASIMEAPM